MSKRFCNLYPYLLNTWVIRCNSTTGAAGMGKAKKKFGKMGAIMEKKVIPVETDAKKIVSFVCGSNILKEGKDLQLKPDSDYPNWLWTLNTGKPKKIEELDPETKEYWIKVRKAAIVQHNRMTKIRKW